ncbi:LysR family transcriptional regulator [Rhizobiaceae bacterium BDR2-2]|uniref:LysR family transcriptional regulator n=1 Tax=Ectorhizobium quercum TaxID=2965071 RepID=A0AAE3N4Q3_9HYPH|nr:LysR family transcriptional regulator [Ectorhizobium quercum]MCX8999901.1 LysR family transcriptional regulator [Ectorhizobium quercum]
MDLFRSMHAFVATVQAGSMSAAATNLGQSPAMVGQHIAALEERLGTRLLNRTTRRQSLTDFGASYFEQCRDILDRIALAEEAAEVQRTTVRGRLRITAPTTFGAEALMPTLAGYRAAAAEVELDIALTDRNVDLVEEGFDVAFRIGAMPDSSMIARPLMPYRMAICAAPAYLARRGTPSHPGELGGHEAIAFTPSARSPWRFTRGEENIEVSPVPMITVNNGQAVRAAACAGLGIIVQPEILLKRDIDEGRLTRLFPQWRLGERPMWLLYYRDRRMTPRLRSFISFAVAAFGSSAGPEDPTKI